MSRFRLLLAEGGVARGFLDHCRGSMRWLQWVTVVVPTLGLVVYLLVGHRYLDWVRGLPLGHVLVVLSGALVAYAFSAFIFHAVGQLNRRIGERNATLAALYAVAARTATCESPQESVERALDEVIAITGASSGGVFLLGPEGDGLSLWLSRNASAGAAPRADGLEVPAGDCGAALALARNEPVVVPLSDSRCHGGTDLCRVTGTCITVPVVSRERLLGALYVVFAGPPHTGPHTKELLKAVGPQVGAALENARLRESMQALAVLEERNRVALELHDGLAQSLAFLARASELVDRLVAEAQREEARARLSEMRAAAVGALREVREAILDLRTPLGSGHDLAVALEETVQRFEAQTGSSVSLAVARDVAAAMTEAQKIQCLRIVQEALSNVRKHAPGSGVSIRLTARGNRLAVTVEDEGPGFELERALSARGVGLQSMTERAESLGGHLIIESAVGAGTRVSLLLPIQRSRGEAIPSGHAGR